jgi:hypothetical protein
VPLLSQFSVLLPRRARKKKSFHRFKTWNFFARQKSFHVSFNDFLFFPLADYRLNEKLKGKRMRMKTLSLSHHHTTQGNVDSFSFIIHSEEVHVWYANIIEAFWPFSALFQLPSATAIATMLRSSILCLWMSSRFEIFMSKARLTSEHSLRPSTEICSVQGHKTLLEVKMNRASIRSTFSWKKIFRLTRMSGYDRRLFRPLFAIKDSSATSDSKSNTQLSMIKINGAVFRGKRLKVFQCCKLFICSIINSINIGAEHYVYLLD